MKIGDRIKNKRLELKITQRKLAEIIGIPFSTLANYENNHREPNLETINKIASALEVSPAELITEKEALNIILQSKLEELEQSKPNIGCKFPKIDTLREYIHTDEDWDTVVTNQHEFYAKKSTVETFSSICNDIGIDLSSYTNKQILKMLNSSVFKSVIEGALKDIDSN